MEFGITLVTSLTGISFILLLLSQGKKQRSLFSFVALLIFYVLWSVFNYISIISDSLSTTIIYMRLVMFVAAYIILFLYEFSNTYPDNKEYANSKFSIGYRLFTILISILSITPLIISSATIEGEVRTPVFGSAIPLYAIYFLVGILSSAIILRNKSSKSSAEVQQQIKFIAIGLLTSVILGTVTNLVFVLIGVTNLVILGPVFLLILLTSIFILLMRGEFFDVRIFFGRLTYYLLTGILPYTLYYGVILLNNALFGGTFELGSIISNIAVAIMFVLIYNNWNRIISERIETNIINPGYNPDKVIAKLNKQLGSTLDPLELITDTVNTINQTVRPNHVGIYLRAGDEEPLIFQQNEALKLSLERIYTVWKNEFGNTIFLAKFEGYEQNKVLKELFEKGVSAIVSIKPADGDPIGIIAIGSNNNLGKFSSSEIEFINSISSSLNVAISRSLLYEEVKQFNKTLQQKVNDATAELQIKNVQLADALRKEKDMMDVLGHELRTPLGTARNAIMMIDSFKQSGKLTDELYNKYIKIAVDNIRREKDLLQTILQSARLENDRLQITKVRFDARKLLETTSVSFKEQAEAKSLSFEIIQPKEPVEIYNDETVLQQIVDNFVSNAVKYTNEGGVKITLEDLGESFRVAVKDTGEGLKEKDLKLIGKKFFRANTHLQSTGIINGERIIRPGGTGIGLYVVKGILKNLGTELEIESEFGKGSTFSFELKKGLDLIGKEEPKSIKVDQSKHDSSESIAELNRKAMEKQKLEPVKKVTKLNTEL